MKHDLQARFDAAKALVASGNDPAALEEFVWLWVHLAEIPEWVGVRSSYLLSALKPLLGRSPAARLRFAGFRDLAQQKLDDRASLQDWLSLNRLLGDDDRSLVWLRALNAGEAVRLELLNNHQIARLVNQFGEWALYGRLIADPEQLLRSQFKVWLEIGESRGSFSEQEMEGLRAHFAKALRKLAAQLVRGLRTAGRVTEAAATGSEARRLDPSQEMQLALVEAEKAEPAP